MTDLGSAVQTEVQSLNVSPDGYIVKILDDSSLRDFVIAVVKVPLRPEQSEYFREQMDLGHVITSINSVKARIGLEQKVLGDERQSFEFVEDADGTHVLYIANFTSFRPDLIRGVTVPNLFVKGIPIGKLYVQNPKLQLNQEEVRELLAREDFYFHNGRTPPNEPIVNPSGSLSLPLHHAVIMRPEIESLTPEFLQKLMRKEVTREQLHELMHPTPLRLQQFAYQPPEEAYMHIFTMPLGTAGHEMVITDERHGNSRVAESPTDGTFYIELLTGFYDAGSYASREFLKVMLYKPLTELTIV